MEALLQIAAWREEWECGEDPRNRDASKSDWFSEDGKRS